MDLSLQILINLKHSLLLSADGIALGAAATTSRTDVEMIVFIAIMLHKVIREDFIHITNVLSSRVLAKR